MTSERSIRARASRAPGALVTLIAGGLALAGCADLSRGGRAADAAATDVSGEGASAADASLSFAADVHGLLTATCARCHVPGQPAGDTQLLFTGDAAADLAAVTPFIDTGTPASSRLLLKMSGQGHGGGVVYAVGTPEYETVLRWIQQGASP
jgi:hypothetical protein